MSGKGNNKSASGSGGKDASTSKSSSSSKQSTWRENESNPDIVTGWEYHTYARNDDRYQYIGKDDSGEPEFLDYGRKAK